MKSTLLVLSFIILSPVLLFSQDNKVQEIDKHVEEFYQSLEEETTTRSAFTIVNSEVQRAIGPVLKTVFVIYDIIELTTENGVEPVEFGRARNLMAYLESSDAGAYRIEKSWFYNQDGELIYYLENNSTSGCSEVKCYFDNNEAIRLISSTLLPEDYIYEKLDENECNYIRNAGEFTPEDLKKISEIKSQIDRQFSLLKALSDD